MARRHSNRPAKMSDVVDIIGPLDASAVSSILATGATAAEVLEAKTRLLAGNDAGRDIDRTPSGRVAQVYDILADTMRVDADR
jgi:ribosomal protein S28E/S33